jgi:uncharacterized protein YbjQ (UPF0145 family)
VTIDPEILKLLDRIGDATVAVPCLWRDKAAGIAVNDRQVAFASKGVARKVLSGPLAQAVITDGSAPLHYQLRVHGESVEFVFVDTDDARRFLIEFSDQKKVLVDQLPPRLVAPAPKPVLIVTMNDIPGYKIVEVHGDVFGLVVRARNIFSNMGASLRTISGGEVGGYTKLLSEARNDARSRLAEDARKHGANAVVAMRFDSSEIGDSMSETVAYGTAVTIVKIAKAAQPAD